MSAAIRKQDFGTSREQLKEQLNVRTQYTTAPQLSEDQRSLRRGFDCCLQIYREMTANGTWRAFREVHFKVGYRTENGPAGRPVESWETGRKKCRQNHTPGPLGMLDWGAR